MQQRLLTVPETAERFRASRRTVTTLIATGELKSIRIGRLRRVPEAEVERFISARLGAK